MKFSWVHSTFRSVEPSRLESPESPELSRRQGITRWRVRVWFDPSSFVKSVLDVSSSWVSLSVSVLCSPAEVNLRTIWRRQLLHISTPCRQPDLVSSSTVVNGLSFGTVTLPYSKGSVQGWGHLRASSGVWGIYGSSLPSWLGLSPANFRYRENFSQSTHEVGMALSQFGVVT